MFQSTRPARGATPISPRPLLPRSCFNPRAPRGARLEYGVPSSSVNWFQSTRPARGATGYQFNIQITDLVSIHAPRAGRDAPPCASDRSVPSFNPRAPRGARRRCVYAHAQHALFQSTRPARGATTYSIRTGTTTLFQSTRPARGATSIGSSPVSSLRFQSTRPARGATFPAAGFATERLFQSTRPARGATHSDFDQRLTPVSFNPRAPRGARRRRLRRHPRRKRVSIHAPRAGRDPTPGRPPGSLRCFNPRAPRGARRCTAPGRSSCCRFNPRAPRGARRGADQSEPQLQKVSIHAPRAGRDNASRAESTGPLFQSTRPARGATPPRSPPAPPLEFQSTRPARGATLLLPLLHPRAGVSIHAPRAQRFRIFVRLEGSKGRQA